MANFCSNCGKPIPSGSTFCPNCGSSVNTEASMSGPSGYQQPGYQAPNAFAPQQVAPQPVRRRNGVAVAGFVLSLLGLIFCWFPILNFFLVVPGLILSFIGVFREPRGKAVAGLILSAIAILTFIILVSASYDYGRFIERILD